MESATSNQVFANKLPHPWQLQMFIKCAEGCDTFCIAGMGFGKSLVFALLAIAVELAGSKGTVVVVCPLKALEIDQVSTPSLRSSMTHIKLFRSDGLTWLME